MLYELNYYPTESGDGIFCLCNTKTEALQMFKKLEKQYPTRTGDAFIKVWKNYDTIYAEVVKDIDL